MVNFTIFAGGFSTFIASYVFDSDANILSLQQQFETGTNPSWIALHPENSSVLYAVNEIGPIGDLQSFLISPDGALSLVDTAPTGGNGPTFTNPVSTGEVSAMNFGSPNASFIPTVAGDPARFLPADPSFVVEFPVGDGPSNPHMSLEFNGEVFVPDLGADKIWRLQRSEDGVFTVAGQIDVDVGSGPRHIAIQDDVLFTIHEKTNALTAQFIPLAPSDPTLPLIANVSIVPPDQPAGAIFAAAEILISTPTEKFPNPLIYVSNRNIGTELDPRGDSIAIFEFVNGTDSTGAPAECVEAVNSVISAIGNGYHSKKRMVKRTLRHPDSILARAETIAVEAETVPTVAAGPQLVLKAQVFTGLQQIRSMSLGRVDDGGDEFLIAGANVEGGVVVFQRVDEGRGLEEVARNTELESRTSFVFASSQ